MLEGGNALRSGKGNESSQAIQGLGLRVEAVKRESGGVDKVLQ